MVGPMVCRTNGVSDQWCVGPMVYRANDMLQPFHATWSNEGQMTLWLQGQI